MTTRGMASIWFVNEVSYRYFMNLPVQVDPIVIPDRYGAHLNIISLRIKDRTVNQSGYYLILTKCHVTNRLMVKPYFSIRAGF